VSRSNTPQRLADPQELLGRLLRRADALRALDEGRTIAVSST